MSRLLKRKRHLLLELSTDFQLSASALRLRPKPVFSKSLFEMSDGEWDIPELRELLQEILLEYTTFDNFKVEHEFPRVGHKVLMLNARRLEREHGLPRKVLLAMEDVTEKSFD